MADVARCIGRWWQSRAHDFVPRYAEKEEARTVLPDGMDADWFAWAHADQMTLLSRTYHGDVCTRCGLVVNVPPSPSSSGGDPQ